MEGTEGHLQIKFLAKDFSSESIPSGITSIPASATANEFNALLNATAAENDDNWKEVSFDFLIAGVLFRGNLENFIVENNIAQESIIEVECILRQPAPEPDQDIPHEDWISGIKTTADYIFSTTYGGELTAFSHKGIKLGSLSFGEDPLKCLDVLTINGVPCVVTGSQDQVITLSKIQKADKKLTFEPWQVYRGHERSVECVSAKSDGTRIVSGGFDSFLKVWNTEDDGKTEYAKTDAAKKKKLNAIVKTPMVTLQSHKDAIVGVEWHPLNSKQVVTASMDHNIIAWDLELAGFVTRLNGARAFTSLSLNPTNGLIVTGSADNKIRLWDLTSQEGAMVKDVFHGHNGWVTDVHWSPENVNQFVSSSFDQTVRMWDVRSAKAPLYDIIAHDDRVLTVDWSIRSLIASGASDNALKTFRVK
uniref:Ribosome biogenesis protein WDR12 homolog n=1 Tax=Panagrolaimus superbus TaxID=310955 RepID=A0A914YH22_9BILA